MRVEEVKAEAVKVISGLRYKSETKKREKPGKMHPWGGCCGQWDFNSTGTSEKCRERIPDKTLPRVKTGHLSPPNGHHHGSWTTPSRGYSLPFGRPLLPLVRAAPQPHRGCGTCLGGGLSI